MKKNKAPQIVQLRTPPSRQGFESWLSTRHPASNLEFSVGTGKYYDPEVQRSWEAWTAGRLSTGRRGRTGSRRA